MRHLFLGIAVLLFGLFVGGVGVASAGIGIGVPMIPLGIYLTYRGWRIYKHEETTSESGDANPSRLVPLEETKIGKLGIGILLILLGAGTSALIVGIPIFLSGEFRGHEFRGQVLRFASSEFERVSGSGLAFCLWMSFGNQRGHSKLIYSTATS